MTALIGAAIGPFPDAPSPAEPASTSTERAFRHRPGYAVRNRAPGPCFRIAFSDSRSPTFGTMLELAPPRVSASGDGTSRRWPVSCEPHHGPLSGAAGRSGRSRSPARKGAVAAHLVGGRHDPNPVAAFRTVVDLRHSAGEPTSIIFLSRSAASDLENCRKSTITAHRHRPKWTTSTATMIPGLCSERGWRRPGSRRRMIRMP